MLLHWFTLRLASTKHKSSMLTLYQYVEAKGAGKILMTKQMPATLSQKENKSLLRLRAFLKPGSVTVRFPGQLVLSVLVK